MPTPDAHPQHAGRDPWLLAALIAPLPVWMVMARFNITAVAPWWSLLLLAPVLEELAFRGTIQTLLLRPAWGRRSIGPISLANLITALLFGLAHAAVHGQPWAALTLLPGLVFGFFRERYQRLTPAILLHGWYNLGLVLM